MIQRKVSRVFSSFSELFLVVDGQNY